MEANSADSHDVPEILLLTHGNMGTEMIKSAEMIIGEVKGVYSIPLTQNISVEEYREQVRQKIQKMGAGSIVLADLFGGTPCNTAAALSQELPVCLVAGVNLTSLIDSIQLRETCQGRELCEQVAQSAQDGVRVICLSHAGV